MFKNEHLFNKKKCLNNVVPNCDTVAYHTGPTLGLLVDFELYLFGWGFFNERFGMTVTKPLP